MLLDVAPFLFLVASLAGYDWKDDGNRQLGEWDFALSMHLSGLEILTP